MFDPLSLVQSQPKMLAWLAGLASACHDFVLAEAYLAELVTWCALGGADHEDIAMLRAS